MSSLSKSGLPRWPSWVGGGDFRRRAESALTHPVTVASLGVLLLNDLLFKSLWPHSWLTGKLSDLAWLMFALPLLAFLLSFAARGSLRASRLAFLVAYAGLPILYAAFNTFEPVHDVIMRGISLAGGAAGSPRDATDSLVIPLAWAAALWVLRREVPAAGAMRLRWAVLVMCFAALAIGSSCEREPLYGVKRIGVSGDGAIVVEAEYGPFKSVDGGMTWNTSEGLSGPVHWGGGSADTPWGRFVIDGPRVVSVGDDRVVYSTEYLARDGNLWVQKVSTERLNSTREISLTLRGIAFDDQSGNLVLALGIQGVVVGAADGEWRAIAVGPFEPTEFSLTGKTLLLLTDLKFWTATLALALSMTGVGLIASRYPWRVLRWSVPTALLSTIMAIVLLVNIVTGPRNSIGDTFGLLIALCVPFGPIVVAIAVDSTPRYGNIRALASINVAVFPLLASVVLLFAFGYSDDERGGISDLLIFAVSILAYFLVVVSLLVSWDRLRRWPLVIASVAGMTVLVTLVFMLWLHLSVDEIVTKSATVALCGVAAGILAGYIGHTTPVEVGSCSTCGSYVLASERQGNDCGALQTQD